MNRVQEEAQQAGLVEEAGAAYVWVMDHGISARRYDLASHAFESGTEYCSNHGLELFRLYLLAYQARLSLCRGDWARAATMADSVLSIPRTSILPRIVALVVLRCEGRGVTRATGTCSTRLRSWPNLLESWSG